MNCETPSAASRAKHALPQYCHMGGSVPPAAYLAAQHVQRDLSQRCIQLHRLATLAAGSTEWMAGSERQLVRAQHPGLRQLATEGSPQDWCSSAARVQWMQKGPHPVCMPLNTSKQRLRAGGKATLVPAVASWALAAPKQTPTPYSKGKPTPHQWLGHPPRASARCPAGSRLPRSQLPAPEQG